MTGMSRSLFALVLAAGAAPAFAWDSFGHMVVADVAWRDLKAHAPLQLEGRRGPARRAGWSAAVLADPAAPALSAAVARSPVPPLPALAPLIPRFIA